MMCAASRRRPPQRGAKQRTAGRHRVARCGDALRRPPLPLHPPERRPTQRGPRQTLVGRLAMMLPTRRALAFICNAYLAALSASPLPRGRLHSACAPRPSLEASLARCGPPGAVRAAPASMLAQYTGRWREHRLGGCPVRGSDGSALAGASGSGYAPRGVVVTVGLSRSVWGAVRGLGATRSRCRCSFPAVLPEPAIGGCRPGSGCCP